MVVASALEKQKRWIDSWMSRKATGRCCGAQRGECHALLRLGKNTNLPTFSASRLGCCTLPSWSQTPVCKSLSQRLGHHKAQTSPAPPGAGTARQSWTAKPTSRERRPDLHQLRWWQNRKCYFRGSEKLWHDCVMNPVFEFTELPPRLCGDEALLGVTRAFKIVFQHNKQVITRPALKKYIFCKN